VNPQIRKSERALADNKINSSALSLRQTDATCLSSSPFVPAVPEFLNPELSTETLNIARFRALSSRRIECRGRGTVERRGNEGKGIAVVVMEEKRPRARKIN
jgi:hypothetical protein